jgi:hypothetical protein
MRPLPARFGLALSAALVAVVLLAPIASAKGASRAVITGPGLAEPIVLREEGATGGDLAALADESGFYIGAWGALPHRRIHEPAGDLGPRYAVTYTMLGRDGDEIVQYVFPYAEPRPITYMPPHQPLWSGGRETVGAWVAAHADLRRTLVGLGLPATAPSTSAASATTVEVVEGRDSSAVAWIVVATALILLLAISIWPRRSRPPIDVAASPAREPH